MNNTNLTEEQNTDIKNRVEKAVQMLTDLQLSITISYEKVAIGEREVQGNKVQILGDQILPQFVDLKYKPVAETATSTEVIKNEPTQENTESLEA